MQPKAARKHGNKSRKVNVFRNVERTPSRYTGAMVPVNMVEQKERFLRYGITPTFELKGSSEAVAKHVNNSKGEIRRTYFKEAKHILEVVKNKYGDGGKFINTMYGEQIDYVKASKYIAQYLKNNNLQGEMAIYWAPDLSCSAKIMWRGPSLKCNRPEARKYTLLLNCNSDNVYLRKTGITCLANHEIGTHYFRMFNDGFQPWYSDRSKFGIRPMSSREANATEEGLATINTIIQGQTNYLWSSALLYYTACMAEEMTFRELFDHIGQYLEDKELRWRHVMRIKRGLRNPNNVGGYGNDQIYFEGAVEILRNYERLDLYVLYAGKICWDEVDRVRRLARKDCIRIPHFVRDIEAYKKKLRQIALANGLIARSTATTRRMPSPAKLLSRGSLESPSAASSSWRGGRRVVESGYHGYCYSNNRSPCPYLQQHQQQQGSPSTSRKQTTTTAVTKSSQRPKTGTGLEQKSSGSLSTKLSAEVLFVNERPSSSTVSREDEEFEEENQRWSSFEDIWKLARAKTCSFRDLPKPPKLYAPTHKVPKYTYDVLKNLNALNNIR